MKVLRIEEIKKLDLKNKKTVLCGGCFDVLHDGHYKFLKESKKLGDLLIVMVESDERISKTKGKDRPKNKLPERLSELSKLDSVDIILPLERELSNKDYYNLVKELEPDIIAVTKGDPLLEIKKDQAIQVGGKVVEVIERDSRYSSTKIITK